METTVQRRSSQPRLVTQRGAPQGLGTALNSVPSTGSSLRPKLRRCGRGMKGAACSRGPAAAACMHALRRKQHPLLLRARASAAGRLERPQTELPALHARRKWTMCKGGRPASGGTATNALPLPFMEISMQVLDTLDVLKNSVEEEVRHHCTACLSQ